MQQQILLSCVVAVLVFALLFILLLVLIPHNSDTVTRTKFEVRAFQWGSFKYPTALTMFGPSLLVGEEHGKVWEVYKNREKQLLFDLGREVRTDGVEQGLLDLTAIRSQRYGNQVFVTFTSKQNELVLRRYVIEDSQVVEHEDWMRLHGLLHHHYGGTISLDTKRGYLYLATGDFDSQQERADCGKLFRFNLATKGGDIHTVAKGLCNPASSCMFHDTLFIGAIGLDEDEQVKLFKTNAPVNDDDILDFNQTPIFPAKEQGKIFDSDKAHGAMFLKWNHEAMDTICIGAITSWPESSDPTLRGLTFWFADSNRGILYTYSIKKEYMIERYRGSDISAITGNASVVYISHYVTGEIQAFKRIHAKDVPATTTPLKEKQHSLTLPYSKWDKPSNPYKKYIHK